MSIVDRHKKPGGFKKLVYSLEVTAPEKRAKILDSFRAEDPEFTKEVEACILTFEEIVTLPETAICEILHTANMKNVAFALYKADQSIVDKFKRNIPPKRMIEFRDESESIAEIRVADQMAAKFRIVEAARSCEEKGLISIKKMNPKYL